jgi:hypothetical protein
MKKIPVIIEKEFLKDKNCDYHALMVASCFGTNNLKKKNISIDSRTIRNEKEDIERISHKSWTTTYKSLMKMSAKHKDLIKIKKIKKENTYTVSYGNKNSKGYILIDDNIIKILLRNKDSATIKTYMLLKMICKNESKIVTRSYICDNIGLASSSTTNLNKITKITNFLEESHLIKKEYIENNNCTRSIKYSII